MIGRARTPYHYEAPYQPDASEAGDEKFYIELDPQFAEGLQSLETFNWPDPRPSAFDSRAQRQRILYARIAHTTKGRSQLLLTSRTTLVEVLGDFARRARDLFRGTAWMNPIMPPSIALFE